MTGQGGGVLLAVSKRLNCEEQPDLTTDCNITWVKISINGIRLIYVSSFYKTHENDEKSLTELWKAVKMIPQNSTIWIFGDFNMPDFDWSNECPKRSCKLKPMYDDFLENLTNFNLEQIDQTKPDIIACTETWLKPEIKSSEIFPDSLGYNVFRDDRMTGQGGGVLLAVSKRLNCEEQPDLTTDCNITWVKISINGIRLIYVSSFYKPHENDEKSLTELWKAVKMIPQNSTIWIFGDFNMPDFDWSNECPKRSCKLKPMYDDFLENLTNFNLEQIVKIPTRNDNVFYFLPHFVRPQINKVFSLSVLI